MRAAATFSAWVRSAMPYSCSTVLNEPKLAVSTTSTPTAKKSSCMAAMTSGLVRHSISLQPSSSAPPKSSAERSSPWMKVPKAPSNTTRRSLTESR